MVPNSTDPAGRHTRQIRIAVSTDPDATDFAWIQWLYTTSGNAAHRSKRLLLSLVTRNRVFVAHTPSRSMSALIGCLLTIPLSPRVQELAGLYIVPEFRRKGVGRLLLHTAVQRNRHSTCCAFVFEPYMVELLRTLGFSPASLSTLPFAARLRLLLQRLNLTRIKQITSQSRANKPVFLVRQPDIVESMR